MILQILTLAQYLMVLIFGIFLSASFAGVDTNARNSKILGALAVGCALVQLVAYMQFGEEFVWVIYPVLAHLPVALVLCLKYKKRSLSALACVAAAYMCCQPANWLGETFFELTGNAEAEQVLRIVALLVSGMLVYRFVSASLAALFEKENRDILIFACIPFVYYIFDYSMSVYSEGWIDYNAPIAEFLPFLLCFAFLLFSAVYYKAYEKRIESEQRNKVVGMAIEQQRREMDAMRRNEEHLRILRHDIRFLLAGVMACLNEDDSATARELLEQYTNHLDKTTVQRFCENDLINYTISGFKAHCEESQILFSADVAIPKLDIDELIFCSLLSNALDNAVNATKELPESERKVKLSLKESRGRLLLVVTNPMMEMPEFVDDVPVNHKPGHGYGTQSIIYAAENLGGNCRFFAKGDQFTLQVIISL